jgi:hypothetical protein
LRAGLTDAAVCTGDEVDGRRRHYCGTYYAGGIEEVASSTTLLLSTGGVL